MDTSNKITDIYNSITDKFGMVHPPRNTNKKKLDIINSGIGKNNQYVYHCFKLRLSTSGDSLEALTKLGGTKDISERVKAYRNSGMNKEGKDHVFPLGIKVPDEVIEDMGKARSGHYDELIRDKKIKKNDWFNDNFEKDEGEFYRYKKSIPLESAYDEVMVLIENLNALYTEAATGSRETYYRHKVRTLYKHQRYLYNEIRKVFTTEDVCLAFAAPRTGKSLVSIVTAVMMNYKTIVVISQKPRASESFREVAEEVSDITIDDINKLKLNGWRFFDSSNIDTWKGDPTKCIFLISFQISKYNKKNKETNEIEKSPKYTAFKEQLDCWFADHPNEKAFMVIDECHNASDTTPSEVVINSFSYCDKKLYMSGTPFNDIFANRFKKEQIVKYTLLDAIADFKKGIPNSVKFPHMRIEQMKEVNKAIKEAMKKNKFLDSIKYDFDGNALDNLKLAFLSYDRTYAFWNSLLVKASWLSKKKNRNIFAYVPDDFSYIDSNGEKKRATPAEWSVEALKKLRGYYTENCPSVFPLCGYNVIPSFGGKNAEETDINEFLNKKDTYNIVICKNSHTTGETFPRLDTILVLKKIASAELFWQLGCRPMSWYKGKEDTDVYIYLFDKDMALSMTGALVSSSSYGNKSEEDVINLIRELDLITISIEGFDFDRLSVTDILQAIHKVTDRELMSMASSCNKELSFFLDNLDDDSLNKLALCGKKKKASERAYTSADKEPSPFSKGDGNEDNGEDLSSKKKSNKDKGKGKDKDTTDGKEDNTETLRDKARRTVALFLEKFPSEVFVSDLTGDSNVKVEIANAEFYTKDIRKEFGEEVFNIFMNFIEDNLDIFSNKAYEVINKRDSLDKFDRYDFLVKSCSF